MYRLLYKRDAVNILKEIALDGVTKTLRYHGIGRSEFRRMNSVLKTHNYNEYNDKKTLNKSYILLSYITYMLERG